jgi:hypothetical protein
MTRVRPSIGSIALRISGVATGQHRSCSNAVLDPPCGETFTVLFPARGEEPRDVRMVAEAS